MTTQVILLCFKVHYYITCFDYRLLIHLSLNTQSASLNLFAFFCNLCIMAYVFIEILVTSHETNVSWRGDLRGASDLGDALDLGDAPD